MKRTVIFNLLADACNTAEYLLYRYSRKLKIRFKERSSYLYLLLNIILDSDLDLRCERPLYAGPHTSIMQRFRGMPG